MNYYVQIVIENYMRECGLIRYDIPLQTERLAVRICPLPLIKMKTFKVCVAKVNDLSPEEKEKAMDKLSDMPWSSRVNYKGYVELHYGFNSIGEMTIQDIVPIEGTDLDWIRRSEHNITVF